MAAAEPSEPRGSAYDWILSALAWIGLLRYTNADDALKQARQLDAAVEQSAVYWLPAALVAGGLERHQATLDALEQSTALNPGLDDLSLTWNLRGAALSGLGHTDQALEAYDRSIELATPPSASDLFVVPARVQKGYLLWSMGRTEEALAALTEAADRAEELRENDLMRLNAMAAHVGRGVALYRLERSDDALAALDRATDIGADLPADLPHRNVAWLAKGSLLDALERDEESLQAYGRAVEIDPQDPAALIDSGYVLVRLQDYDRARRVFAVAAELTTDREQGAALHFGRGQVLSRLGQYERAIDAFRSVIALSPDHARVWEFLGDAYSKLDRHEAAYRAFYQGWQRLDDLGTDRAVVLSVGVSGALIALERDQDALEYLLDAKPRVKDDPRLDFNLGVAAYHLDKQDAALRAWEDAARGGFHRAGELVKELKRSFTPAEAWRDFWFSQRSGWGRPLLGGGLAVLTMLCALALLPFALRPSAGDRLRRFELGGDWIAIAVALVVLVLALLLPVLRRIQLRSVSASLGPVTFEAVTASPEAARPPLNIEEQIDAMRQALGRAQAATQVGWSPPASQLSLKDQPAGIDQPAE
jgi:tetratricopeptide (TPR) repeat protein